MKRYPSKTLYISQANQEIADTVFQLAEEKGMNFSDWVWEACRLRLAGEGKLPIALALRPMLEELFEEYLGNGRLMVGVDPAREGEESADGFFGSIVEGV